MPLCSRRLWATSARPVRTAVPSRFMSSEEGGIGTVSSSVLRTRSRRAVFGVALFLAVAGPPFGALGAVFRTFAGRTGRLFLVGRFPEGAFLVRLRPVERVERDGFVRFWAFRLAIGLSFHNLDSVAISVVLSVAYRNSAMSPQWGQASAGIPAKVLV